MIAPELRRHTADPSWPTEDGRRLDAAPPAMPQSTSGLGITHSLRSQIGGAVTGRPWIIVAAAAIVGILVGWLAKRR